MIAQRFFPLLILSNFLRFLIVHSGLSSSPFIFDRELANAVQGITPSLSATKCVTFAQFKHITSCYVIQVHMT